MYSHLELLLSESFMYTCNLMIGQLRARFVDSDDRLVSDLKEVKNMVRHDLRLLALVNEPVKPR
jgi:hypothetical protein